MLGPTTVKNDETSSRYNDHFDPLLRCIQKSDCRGINALLKGKKPADINKKYQGYEANGVTPLLFAAQMGNRKVVLLLLSKGANVSDITDDGFNALHLAAYKGHTKILQDLVKAGIDINSLTTSGLTALHLASKGNKQGAVAKLLELKADSSIQALNPVTPANEKKDTQELNKSFDLLMEFVVKGNCNGIKLLLDDETVDLNKHYGPSKKTALHVAAQMGNRDVVRLLLSSKRVRIQAVTDCGFNALHIAAQFVQTDILQDLVDAGIDVNSVCDTGTTALHEAAGGGHHATTVKLLELKADPSIKDPEFYKTAYELAYLCGHKSICGAISDFSKSKDSSISEVNDMFNVLSLDSDDANDALLDAIKGSNCPKIGSLIDKRIIDVNKRYVRYGGKTPLHFACQLGNRDVVLLLLAKGANVQAVTERGFNALHVAAQFGHTGILQDLVSAGIDVNAFISQVGTTALHEAAANGRQEATSKLLELKADITIKDGKFGLTAYDLALSNGHRTICDILSASLNYKQRFIRDVNKVLYDAGLSLNINSYEIGFVLKLRTAIEQAPNADDVFKVISEHLKSEEFKQFARTLAPLKKSLIELMKQYNAEQAKVVASNAASNVSDKEVKRNGM